MKKLVTFITSMLLVVMMFTVLCGCSSYSSIKSAFKKEGYEETDLDSKYQSNITAIAGEDYESVASVHCLKKQPKEGGSLLDQAAAALGYVIILEFNSTKDMEEKFKDKVSAEDAENVYNKLQELDSVSGNCILVFTLLPEGSTIFKSTKK